MLSVGFEYVPKNDLETIYYPNEKMTVLVTRDSTILIPFRNVLDPVMSPIKVTVDYEDPVRNIRSVKLSTTTDSVLSYYGDFKNFSNKDTSPVLYKMNVSARHDLTSENTSSLYTIDIFYTNQTGDQESLDHTGISFTWPIKTMNLSALTYFWILLIGVIVGRATTSYLAIKDKNEQAKDKQQLVDRIKDLLGIQRAAGAVPDNQINDTADFALERKTRLTFGRLDSKDIFWIGLSGVIALLIFSNFQRDVTLTGNILTDISLAFAFGFGLDKSLETIQRFRSS
ncbi:MAG: hypothetical protein GEU26_18580 [Nitrososphaeraceae archaeon]|nr:hypothetical protein [Nitrososphaeraceae archaeon]